MCDALTSGLDDAISLLANPGDEPLAVIALGGYGRGELSPYSDVDLMLLHDVADPSVAAAGLFRPLWDAKLKVGHSVRTVGEAATAARDRFDTQTTLLTARFVTGSTELFDRLMEAVSAVTRARPLRRHLVAAERMRREETPFLLMATDVKNGRGGLRTLQGFEWERRREALIGRFSADLETDEVAARETLLRVRNALHISAGRAHDVFSPELRQRVAGWLGDDVLSVATDLVEAMQSVDRMAEKRWPEVLEDRRGPLRRRIWFRISGRVEPASGTTEPSIEQFTLILAQGEQGRAAFEHLWEQGLLDRVLPEWGVVRSLPHLEAFHEHPVAAHLWRSVDEMLKLMAGDDHLGRVAGELDRPDLLPLVAFLHDIGKGHGGDHSRAGAGIARSFCERLGVDQATSELIAGAVRLHLLLPTAATRRDLDDPAVIDDVASRVGSLEMLQVLYLLTVADSRATGASMWTEWKATLVRTLFLRCAARFEGELSAGATSIRSDVFASAHPDRQASAADHLDGMPGDYARSAGADDVLWHLDLIAELDGFSRLGVRSDDPYDTAVVVGPTIPARRQVVAAALAANGVDVLEARLHTREDGMVVDSFRVRDDRTRTAVPNERWARIAQDIEAGLSGRLDTAAKVADRAAAYPPPSGEVDKPAARAAVDPATGDLVVTVKCSDRIGRLAEILSVLGDMGLEIRLAKLDSRKGEVIDTFHVEASEDLGDLQDLGHRVAAGIAP
ncbi:MAG: HD domain-containing protein [Acidimicrobiia bacterium]